MAGAEISAKRAELRQGSDEKKRAQIPVRTTAKAKAALQEAADSNDRSLTQEIEQRLERSLEADERRSDPQTARLVEAIAASIAGWNEYTGKPWHQDRVTFHAALLGVADVMNSFAPPFVNDAAMRATWDEMKAAKRAYETAQYDLETIGAWVTEKRTAYLGALLTPRTGMFGFGSGLAGIPNPGEENNDEFDYQIIKMRQRGMRHDDGTDYTPEELDKVADAIHHLRQLKQDMDASADAFQAAYKPQEEAARVGAELVKHDRDRRYAVARSLTDGA